MCVGGLGLHRRLQMSSALVQEQKDSAHTLIKAACGDCKTSSRTSP